MSVEVVTDLGLSWGTNALKGAIRNAAEVKNICNWATRLSGAGCFAEGTEVAVAGADGEVEFKPIEQIQVGDQVVTRDQNDASGVIESRSVTQVYVHRVYSLLDLSLIDDHGNTQTLQTTDPHPFYVEGKGWTPAAQLKAGDQVLSEDGRDLTIQTALHETHPEGITVYNLEVEGDHTYFVAANIDGQLVWVHNGGPCSIQGHHPIPKFLGGEFKQKLYGVKRMFHEEFHTKLANALNKEFSVVKEVPNAFNSSRDKWSLFLENKERNARAIKILKQVSEDMDTKNGTEFLKYVLESLK